MKIFESDSMKIAFPNGFNYSIIEGFLNILSTFNEKLDAI